MMRHCALGLMLAGSAHAATPADLEPIQSGLDYHSFANIEQFRVTRLELDLRVDSGARVLRGGSESASNAAGGAFRPKKPCSGGRRAEHFHRGMV